MNAMGKSTIGAGLRALATGLALLAFLGSESSVLAQSQTSFGGDSANDRKLGASNTNIGVEKRTDNVMDRKKQKQSKREAAESKGKGLVREPMERIKLTKEFLDQLNREIRTFNKVIPTMKKNAPERPRMLQRLIESQFQKSLVVFQMESRAYDERWHKWDRGGRNGEEPVLDTSKSKEVVSRVIQTSMQMITEYPKFRNLDEVYFQVAYALDSLDKFEDASNYYGKIIKMYPNSKRIADSYYALGEYHFNANDFRKALSSYNQVMKYTRAPIYPWAVYKIAWCQFNLQQYDASLATFKRVVLESTRASRGSSAEKMQLKEQALRDMVNVYVELGGRLEEAERYYKSVQGGTKFYWDMLLRLSDQLRERGQYAKSIEVLKRYVSQDLFSIRTAEIQIDIVNIAAELDNKKILWDEMTNLLSRFNPQTQWAAKNQKDPAYPEVAGKIVKVGVNIPKEHHARYQKTGNQGEAANAERGYEIFLKYYEKHPSALEIRFLMAELQYQSNRYDACMPHFFKIASLGPNGNKFFAKSGEYYISAAYLEADKAMKELRKQAVDPKGAPRPISQNLQNYIAACGNFIKWFPKAADKVKSCETDTAEIYLKHNDRGQSDRRLTEIALKYPTEKEGKTSVEMLLVMAKDNPQMLVQRAKQFAKVDAYKNDKVLGPRLREIIRADEFNQGTQSEEKGEFVKASKVFERFAVDNPDSADADKAWFNAGNNYKKANEFDKAIECYRELYKRYPKSTLIPNALLLIAEISSDAMDLPTAAAHSELFATRYATDKRSKTVLMETCRLYGVLNDLPKAMKVCGSFVDKGGANGNEAAQILADLYFQNRQYSRYVDIADSHLLRATRTSSERMTLLNRIVDVELKMNRRSSANKRLEEMERMFRGNRNIQGPGVARVVEQSFKRAFPIYERFRNTNLQGSSGQALMSSIGRKNEALAEVEKAFKQVLSQGEAQWGVASLYILGVTNQTMWADLMNPPLPPGVGQEEVKILRQKFAELAEGFRKKAAEYYAAAMVTVSKELVYTEYARKVATALGQVDPKKNAVLDEWVPDYFFLQSQWTPVGKVSAVVNKLGGK